MAKLRTQVEGDSSLMTYTGHTILQTLIRCHFSPAHTTGQSLIYTGCAAGRVVIYDLLTGEIVKVRKKVLPYLLQYILGFKEIISVSNIDINPIRS